MQDAPRIGVLRSKSGVGGRGGREHDSQLRAGILENLFKLPLMRSASSVFPKIFGAVPLFGSFSSLQKGPGNSEPVFEAVPSQNLTP